MKHEKFPTYYQNCGDFGHWHEECGDYEHDESTFERGDLKLAHNMRNTMGGAGRGNMEGHGGPGGSWGRGT